MKTIVNLILVSLLTVSVNMLNAAPSIHENKVIDEKKASKTLEEAIEAFENVMEDPLNSIPENLIKESEGIVIFPDAFKIAFGCVGGQGARGIAMIRKEDGSWSNPFIVTFGEGSLGFQLGIQSSDIILLFKDRNDIMEIVESELTLGGDISVVAGPVNRGYSSSTDVEFDAEVYSYAQSKGLFAGVCLHGGILSYNKDVNDALYGTYFVDMDEIFNEIETPYNEDISNLIETVNRYGE